jgi:hypothetical protein
MEQPFQNEASNFGKLAEQLIQRRLEKLNIPTSPNDFFPTSPQMLGDLNVAEETVRREAISKYGEDNSKRISDYVYKYKRATYFRSRPSKANRPEYSGFNTLVFLSTGVIRNLLQPCYWMYDKMLSIANERHQSTLAEPPVKHISSAVQSEIILEQSRRMWDMLRDGIDRLVEGCSREDAVHAFQLMDNLALLFRERLLHQKSEPTANSFTISGSNAKARESLSHIIEILRKAQLLYARTGAAKDKGRRETYYVPNRMLWPDRGLDPHGQHARVSIGATDLWSAAKDNRPLPFNDETPLEQETLWYE